MLEAARRYRNASFFGFNPGFIKGDIRSNLFGGKTMLYRFIEWMTGLMSARAEDYVERVAPLLVMPDIEKHSGAIFDKGQAVLPSQELTESFYADTFIAASEALVCKAGVQVAA